MKTWDLTSGASKLDLAMQSLVKTVRNAEDDWDDATYQRFQQQYIAALEPKVRMAIDAIHTLEQVLLGAERACRSDFHEPL